MEPVEPADIAGIVFDRVMDFCKKIHDQPLECITDHNPDQLSVFMDSYLEDEDNDINEAIENSDHAFWEAKHFLKQLFGVFPWRTPTASPVCR